MEYQHTEASFIAPTWYEPIWSIIAPYCTTALLISLEDTPKGDMLGDVSRQWDFITELSGKVGDRWLRGRRH